MGSPTREQQLRALYTIADSDCSGVCDEDGKPPCSVCIARSAINRVGAVLDRAERDIARAPHSQKP